MSGTWLRILRLTLHWRRPNSPFTDLFRFEHPCCQAGDPPAARSPQRGANNGNTRRSLACSLVWAFARKALGCASERTAPNRREWSLRLDKLGVTGPSPVPPTSRKTPQTGFSSSRR